MRRFAFSLLGTVGGYILGAGYMLVTQTSSNTHDNPVEAAMTGAFVSGPFGAIVGGVTGFVLGRRRGNVL